MCSRKRSTLNRKVWSCTVCKPLTCFVLAFDFGLVEPWYLVVNSDDSEDTLCILGISVGALWCLWWWGIQVVLWVCATQSCLNIIKTCGIGIWNLSSFFIVLLSWTESVTIQKNVLLSYSSLQPLNCHLLQVSIHCSSTELQPDVGIILPYKLL